MTSHVFRGEGGQEIRKMHDVTQFFNYLRPNTVNKTLSGQDFLHKGAVGRIFFN